MYLSGQSELVANVVIEGPATAAFLRREDAEGQLPALLPRFKIAPNC